ncbi:MAG: hypothetical protein ACTSRV_07420 [Candidatus Freyarchaeota archaeon]
MKGKKVLSKTERVLGRSYDVQNKFEEFVSGKLEKWINEESTSNKKEGR